jgi:hypothetical protein
MRVRVIAWTVILAAAALRAYTRRFDMPPDGIAYLDLSDAVVQGHWSGLVNGYWSPLYPALIGIARLIVPLPPQWEFTAVHVLNVLLFVLTAAAFEWFLRCLLASAASWKRSVLHSRWGVMGAYVVFGTLAVGMLPTDLPTPDLLVAIAVFVAFGATLRLHAGDRPRLHAAIIGVALGMGMLAKAFLIPWSVVFLTAHGVATVRRWGAKPIAIAVAVAAVMIAPWCVLVSQRVGHPSVGETGPLNYVWNVNDEESPAYGFVPSHAGSADVRAAFGGAAVTDSAPGTNPVWLDPVRWWGALRPHWNTRAQLSALRFSGEWYVRNLAPLTFAIVFALLVAHPADRRRAWQRGWLVYITALTALTAYAVVLVSARFVAPFVIAATVMFGAALSWPRRMTAIRAGLAVLLALGAHDVAFVSLRMLDVLEILVVAMLAAYILHGWPAVQRLVFVAAALGILFVIGAPRPNAGTRLVPLALAGMTWLLARDAVQRGRSLAFSRTMGWALVAGVGVVMACATARPVYSDARTLVTTPPVNASWEIARSLPPLGLTPGMAIALIGSPYRAYWARTARLRIVAVVPEPFLYAYLTAPAAARERLLERFAAHGARYAISVLPPMRGDTLWRPAAVGWVRPLGAPILVR